MGGGGGGRRETGGGGGDRGRETDNELSDVSFIFP